MMDQREVLSPPHPLKKPTFPETLTLNHLQAVFADCTDFQSREVWIHGDSARRVTVCFIAGMVRGERLSDYVLRPLAQEPVLANCSLKKAFQLMEQGILYNQEVKKQHSMDETVAALIDGSCAIFFPECTDVLTLSVATEEKRSVGEPENEPALKGSRDSFVESLRTNTSLIRRRLRSPKLKIREYVIGRQSKTPVDILWLDGIADSETVTKIEKRLKEMDIDGIQSPGDLEEYLVDPWHSPFPRLPFTQRPDRFCRGLLDGRVGILCDALPLGYLAPGTMEEFFKTGQDRAFHWLVVSMLNIVRYLCFGVTLILPGLYIALVTYHPEAIPAKLALSIVAAKQEVPFSTIFEVLIMLFSFEALQEAGLRLPSHIGATVSILGGLIVGNAAVEAHIVSPAVLIAVAIAGIAGYTQPSQDLAGALRLWRFFLAVLASIGGLFGLAIGFMGLIYHLAGLESFAVPYLAPFTVGQNFAWGGSDVIRLPLKKLKWRRGAVRNRNRRNQG